MDPRNACREERCEEPAESSGSVNDTLSVRRPIGCRNCGYLLIGLRPEGECPECGVSIAESLRPSLVRGLRGSELVALRRSAWMQAVAIAIGLAGSAAAPQIAVVAVLPVAAATLLTVASVLALDDLTRGIPVLQARFPLAGAVSVLSPILAVFLVFAGGAAVGASGRLDAEVGTLVVVRLIATLAAVSVPVLLAMPMICYLRVVRGLFSGLARSRTSDAARRGFWAVLIASLVTPLLLFVALATSRTTVALGLTIAVLFTAAIFVNVALFSIHRDAGELLREARFAAEQ